MTLIGGGEIRRKSRDVLRISEADSEMSIQAKTKMNLKKRRKNFRRCNMDLVWL
jgi:hypothetical protein